MILQAGKTSVKLSFSFIALLALMLILSEEKVIVLSLLSSVVHESGHLLCMYLAGDSVSRIELTFFGMRIDKRSTTKLSYRKDILVALGGIIFNFLFATVCLSAYHIIGSADLLMLAIINIIIAAVNSFPTSSLDAGKALKYFMLLHLSKERAELLSERISDAFCVVFTVSTVLYYCFYGVNISLIAVNLYLITITILKKRR